MTLIVQKYGGTSVGSLERIQRVADKIISTKALGYKLVVVVSAMNGETDRLITMANEVCQMPDPRELDALLSTGEQVTIALLCMALIKQGCPARSYTGGQVNLRTDNAYNKARILSIERANIEADLAAGYVVVVAGFQGTDEKGNITTLGRGGSDTTAVALSAALQADECQIYTDVEGIYTADPKIIPDARMLSEVTIEEMLEMSGAGAKVVQIRAVEFAGRYTVPVRVLSTFEGGKGTLIVSNRADLEYPVVSSITFNRDEAKLVIYGLPNEPGVCGKILGPLAEANIEVDMIVQTLGSPQTIDLAFTVHRRDFTAAKWILEKVAKEMGAAEISENASIAKLSLIGMGMRSHAGVASVMFKTLGDAGINIELISTSEIKISVVIKEEYLEEGVRILHDIFQLGEKPVEILKSCQERIA
jgi:aspartate kinase